jgi:hypothetical protein
MKNPIPEEQRPFHGQSLPLGHTGDGSTGVPSDEQGISNRPGDQADAISVQEESPDEDEDEIEVDDEDLDDESDEEEDDEDERTDPSSEPGKPI